MAILAVGFAVTFVILYEMILAFSVPVALACGLAVGGLIEFTTALAGRFLNRYLPIEDA